MKSENGMLNMTVHDLDVVKEFVNKLFQENNEEIKKTFFLVFKA